jgi:hypothetical protein
MDKSKLTPKDFFLLLGITMTLYASVIALMNLLFQTINYAFPDKLAYGGDPYSSGIRVAIATLIIIFPLYLVLSAYVEKIFVVSPEKRELGIRRWLIYLTLFVAGIAVVVDLVTVVNNFLAGELTARFFWKSLSVFVVTGIVFGFYLHDLRRGTGVSSSNLWWAALAIALVAASMVSGFFIMGSPFSARERRLDNRRVSDLQDIQWQIVNYWQDRGKIPSTLQDLEDSISGYRVPSDPLTGERYTSVFSPADTSFELCAVFALSNLGEGKTLEGRGSFGLEATSPYYYPDSQQERWEHEKGRHCFKRTIDPERYPIRKTPFPATY